MADIIGHLAVHFRGKSKSGKENKSFSNCMNEGSTHIFENVDEQKAYGNILASIKCVKKNQDSLTNSATNKNNQIYITIRCY